MAYGSGTLFKRGKKGIWYLQAYVDGQQVGPLSTRTSDRRKAQLQLDRLLGKRARGEITAKSLSSGRDTLGEILDGYLKYAQDNLAEETAYVYQKTINAHLRRPFGDLSAGKLTTKRLEQYRADRKADKDPASDSTISRELS